ncbi:YihY/virulence factor BrkB family protein [Halalkalicoccus jeotgali]|uniref:Ribonuclease BN n=2 Tax=Halalkalicoccus jeotgali TaxID=413810 RepID=D8J815_HALJB|nr:YihY/virulence factor BrkB family protein [Halalkalicoccus jeotgali]ADJ14128.1 ribonuclease BN [Halalkalicoccus jeotgali B3]ELY34690.1 ribonuclease BN [Halalkalicoccus jeotgali B3]
MTSAVGVGREVVEEVRENEATFLAASIAYYAFVSLIPLLLFTFAAVSAVGGQEFANQILDRTSAFLAPAGQEAIEGAITGETGRGGATIAGSVVLLWSALKLFRGLDTAFSIIYDSGLDKSIVGQIANALIVFLSILLAIVGMLVLGTVFALVPTIPFIGYVTPLFALIALSVVFLPMYYFMPDVEGLTVRDAIPGAVLAGVGWALLQSVFGIYASNAGQYEAYGVIGGILLLLTWLYIGGVLIILGAVLNSVLMNRDNDADGAGEELTETTEATDGSGARKASDSRGPDPDIGAEADGTTDSTRTASEEAGTGKRGPAPDVVGLQDEVRSLRTDLDTFRDDIESKTVDKEDVESDLKKYVRKRVRRGHATGWGPYLVLLYGTIMTLGAFFFLSGLVAIAAMIVLWLSTLGLYVVMVTVGTGLGVLGFPGRVNDAIRNWRGD